MLFRQHSWNFKKQQPCKRPLHVSFFVHVFVSTRINSWFILIDESERNVYINANPSLYLAFISQALHFLSFRSPLICQLCSCNWLNSGGSFKTPLQLVRSCCDSRPVRSPDQNVLSISFICLFHLECDSIVG